MVPHHQDLWQSSCRVRLDPGNERPAGSGTPRKDMVWWICLGTWAIFSFVPGLADSRQDSLES